MARPLTSGRPTVSKKPGPTRFIRIDTGSPPSTVMRVFEIQPLTSEFSSSVADRTPGTVWSRSSTCS